MQDRVQVNAVRQGSPVRDIDDVGQRVCNPGQIASFRGSNELANFFLEQRDPELGQRLVDVSAGQLPHRQVKCLVKLSERDGCADGAYMAPRLVAVVWPERS